MTTSVSIPEIIQALPSIAVQHARSTPIYSLLEKVAHEAVKASAFTRETGGTEPFGPFGQLELPYHKMGAVDSLDLFGLDELIIFAFYHANRSRYKKAADIGANIGLHSILMAKCGWSVTAFEPDPTHASILRSNLLLNKSESVTLSEAAVSDKAGTLEFVRVLGNTTSSHLAGAKSNAYGNLERFPVHVESIAEIMGKVDFVKMDAEGQERCIILGTTATHWEHTDMMVEVGSTENAKAIFDHLATIGVNAFAQRIGWTAVTSLADMPTSYKDGSLFITRRDTMPWL